MPASLTDHIKFIERVFGAGRLSKNGKNIDVRCPICAPTDPTKKKLSIRTEDDASHCWTCDYKTRTLAPLIKKFGTQEELVEYRDKFMSDVQRAKHIASSDKVVEQKTILSLPNNFKLLTLASNKDPDIASAKSYLVRRGLSERDFWYHKLGTSDDVRWRRRIIVPSFNASGTLDYFVARTIDDNRFPKYDTPEVSQETKLSIIFNDVNIDWTQSLVICEGVFDAMKCGDNVVPLLGSTLNERSLLFNKIVVNNVNVIVALDGDMWNTKTPRLVHKLEEYDINVVVVDTRSFGDPGAASKQQVADAIAGAKQLNWSDTFFNKLDKASGVNMSVKNSMM